MKSPAADAVADSALDSVLNGDTERPSCAPEALFCTYQTMFATVIVAVPELVVVPSEFIDTEPPLVVVIVPGTAVRVSPFASLEFESTVPEVLDDGCDGEV